MPVVLIHGAGGNCFYWPAETRRLLGFCVYAADLPGHGRSAGRGRQSVGEYAEVVLNWVESLGLRQAVFVGHSMGSAIALSIALEFPQYVLGLGLLGSASRLPVAPVLMENIAHPATLSKAVSMIMSWSFASGAPKRLKVLAEKRLREVRQSVLLGDFVACDSFNITDRLGEIAAPTLVMCGSQDRMTPMRKAQYLVDHIPDAHFEVIEDAGHMLMLEKPKQVAKILSGFMKDIPYRVKF